MPIPFVIEVEESGLNTLKRSSLHRNSFSNRSHGINGIINKFRKIKKINKNNSIYFFSDFLLKKFKTKKNANLKFQCPIKSENICLYSETYFDSQTTYPATWIHILFLFLQVIYYLLIVFKICLILIKKIIKKTKALIPINQQDKEYLDLKTTYDKLNEKIPFLALITSSFPSEKVKFILLFNFKTFSILK